MMEISADLGALHLFKGDVGREESECNSYSKLKQISKSGSTFQWDGKDYETESKDLV